MFLSLSEPQPAKPSVSATDAAIGVILVIRCAIYFSLIACNEYQKIILLNIHVKVYKKT